MSPCAECGAPDAPKSCEGLFHELLVLDYSMRAPWSPVHAVSVSCFYFQHSTRLPASVPPAFYWALLHVYLRGGLAALAPMTDRARRRNSHRHGGRAPMAGDFPGAPPFPDGVTAPTSYPTTITDVALDGTFPAEGHEDRVRLWAAGTVEAWRAGSHTRTAGSLDHKAGSLDHKAGSLHRA
ncbi:DUF5946 family protein [Nonomuraea sp. NPDC050404]|uniref:DUF5946 family protein n=1 Tax=Nonomuraea sp. NPDC050404 TaxID=3155783 RepID=UPI00340B661E